MIHCELNYIILAHINPQQVRRLVYALMSSNSNFYIHIDRNTDVLPFYKELQNVPSVFFLDHSQRQPGTWGDIGIVKATINALEKIVQDRRTGYCILLSGQDYPIKPIEFISDFINKAAGKHFITAFEMPAQHWENGGMGRLNYYKVNRSLKKGDVSYFPSVFQQEFYQKYFLKELFYHIKRGNTGFLSRLGKKRKLPGTLKPFGGDQWWALPVDSIIQVLEYHKSHPEFYKFHEYSMLPDEMFFQTILMELKKVNPNWLFEYSPTYLRWASLNTPSPIVFTSENFTELIVESGNKLFARKFDSNVDSRILDMLDGYIKKTTGQ